MLSGSFPYLRASTVAEYNRVGLFCKCGVFLPPFRVCAFDSSQPAPRSFTMKPKEKIPFKIGDRVMLTRTGIVGTVRHIREHVPVKLRVMFDCGAFQWVSPEDVSPST